jgi:hypothetical protein
MDDSPEARLARWTDRDTAIGLVAEVEQLKAALAERERELANLRERCAQLGNRVAALEVERNGLAASVARARRPSFVRRLYRRARSLAGRVLRR